MTREEIIALARQGRHWEFVPLALRMLQIAPADHGMRLLAATSYARLGLRTPASEQLDRLPPALAGDASVLALRAALAAFTPDEIAPEERLARCDANIEALRARGIDLRSAREAWAAAHQREAWFVTRDGNIVRRSAGAGPDEAWIHFRNDRLEAENFPFPHLAEPGNPAKPSTIEGIFPPWILERLWRTTPRARDGYRTRISVVQESEAEALDALACTDLREIIADDRVEFFIGAGAGERYAEVLNARAHTRAVGPAVTLATVRRRATPGVSESIQRFAASQQAEHNRLQAEVADIYRDRDAAWWRARYANPGEPLRVLIPTCRYSTFVKHSSADLADAFRAAGWEARVLIEPDDTSHMSSLAYLRAISELRPDLVVLINYTRVGIGSFFPPTLPFICWLQDAMPHQFDPALAAKQGPFDFLAGYLHPELFTEFGFSRDRGAVFPVAVSPRKFHAGPVSSAERDRLACDIAYVSHQSETPEAMHARLVREAAAQEPLAARIFEDLRPVVTEIARECATREHMVALRKAAQEASRRVLGSDPPPGTVTLITRQYCYPLADRVIRHQTLAWAARIAERRGWSLNIHGRGWEAHPTLARHARGELAHDEELRASYQCAGVHLHASSSWLLHQRIMECALSGGLPLTRLKQSDLIQWGQAVLHTMALECQCVMERRNGAGSRECGFAVADHAAAMEYTAQLQRLGEPSSWDLWLHPKRYDEFRSAGRAGAEPPAGWVLGDLSETTFRSEEELEARIEQALQDRAWRTRTSQLIASRVRARYTTDALVNTLRQLVERSWASA